MISPLTILVSLASLMTITTLAAPQPKPAGGWSDYKQTSRREIVNRLQSPPQRRTSTIPYQPCANASPNFDAAVYANVFTASNEPADYITNTRTESFHECILLCKNTPTCASGDFQIVRDNSNNCYLIKDPAPPLRTNQGRTAFVLNTNCAAYASKAGASCCNY